MAWLAIVRLKIPTTNIQHPTARKAPSSKLPKAKVPREHFGNWSLEFLWMLDVGIWNFSSALFLPRRLPPPRLLGSDDGGWLRRIGGVADAQFGRRHVADDVFEFVHFV